MRTILADDAILPLTCTRSGTCCHGKDIRITPWELALLAQARGLSAVAFRDAHTRDAGTRLRVEGPPGWRGQPACGQYDPDRGCTVHAARPLACRLYPLGRERQGNQVRIIHEGSAFPCLDGCPAVRDLPQMTVAAYLAGQGVGPFAAARDAYLELAQDLAEGAFVLVFDSGLVDHGNGWKRSWRTVLAADAEARASLMLPGWHDLVTCPIIADPADANDWVSHHGLMLQERSQDGFASLRQPAQLAAASATMLAAALLVIHAVGGDASEVGRRWSARAGV